MLDDTTKTYKLKVAAQIAICKSKDINRVVGYTVAQFFVFELESEEQKEDRLYSYVRHILCRLRSNGPALTVLLG